MKKTSRQIRFPDRPALFAPVLFLLLVVGSVSCSKKDDEAPASQTASTASENRLKTLTLAVAPLLADAQFVDLMENEVKKRFDGETDVLLQDLLSHGDAQGMNLTDRMNNNLRLAGYDLDMPTLLGLFRANGYRLFPHLYIPFKFDERSTLGDRNYSIIYADGDDHRESYTGYRHNPETGRLEPVSGITEDYARQHPVVVINYNERVNQDGLYQPQPEEKRAVNQREIMFKFRVINLPSIESWVSGGPETTFWFYYAYNVTSTSTPLYLFAGYNNYGKYWDLPRDRTVDNQWVLESSNLGLPMPMFYWNAQAIANGAAVECWERDAGNYFNLPITVSYSGFSLTTTITLNSDNNPCGEDYNICPNPNVFDNGTPHTWWHTGTFEFYTRAL